MSITTKERIQQRYDNAVKTCKQLKTDIRESMTQAEALECLLDLEKSLQIEFWSAYPGTAVFLDMVKFENIVYLVPGKHFLEIFFALEQKGYDFTFEDKDENYIKFTVGLHDSARHLGF